MSAWDALTHRLHVLLRPRRYNRELEAERAFHLSLDAMHQEQAARGEYTTADARAAARRRYGNLTVHTEDARHMAGLSWIEKAQQDIRFALRSFRRAPGFTTVAVLTLAIGIGANTAIFSAVDALLLRPLPFAEPERLMKVSLTRPARGERPANNDAIWSWPKFRVFREQQRVFDWPAMYSWLDVTLRTADGAERVTSEETESAYFRALGIQPVIGRLFSAEEDSVPGGPKVVLLSDLLFSRRFNADSTMIGKPIRIGGDQFVVIGVMPRGFRGLTGKAEMWIPILASNPDAAKEVYNHSWEAIARLKPGVTVDAGKLAMEQMGRVVDTVYPDVNSGGAVGVRHGAIARELDATRVDPLVKRSLFVLLAAVAIVLLIACANVANLFLVRAAGRGHEIAVRLAMGATRGRVIRQLLTESVLLSSLGGVLGVFIAWAGVRALSAIDPTRTIRARQLKGLGAVNFSGIQLDSTALAVALGLAILTGLIFGSLPALQATRSALSLQLRNGRTGGSGRSWLGMNSRNVLVGVEIAFAVVLLAASGLMMRSLGKLLSVKPGFETEHILTMRLNTREGIVRDSAPGFYDAVAQRLAGLPTVTAVTVQDCPPLNGGCNGTAIWRNDRPPMAPGMAPPSGVHWIAPNWPQVMSVPLKQGRLFDAGDHARNRKVVLISETAVRTLFPNENPIGKPIGVGQGGFDSAYVVGVIADVRYKTIDSLPGNDVYLPLAQSPRGRMMLMVRTSGNPETLIPSARAALREFAPDLPLYDVRPMQSRLADGTAYQRFGTIVLMLFGGIALALATLGTYGVIAFAVSQRTREIGIRMALGAQAQGVVRMIVGQGVRVALVGATVGLVGALMTTRVLSSLLYDVAPTDPLTFAAIISLLLAAVALACWIPARRAAGIQPTEALREE